MTPLAGVSGSLFPERFLADWLVNDRAVQHFAASRDQAQHRFLGWWRRVETICGPATGLRALFDSAAMPLAALLGFRARDALFERGRVVVRLDTKRGSTVGLIVLPWAARPSRLWRELADDTRSIGADWCLLVALPFISLVDARGHAMRRGLDFVLPHAFDTHSFPAFWLLCQAAAFDAGAVETHAHITPIDLLVGRAAAFQDAVRQDLRDGVVCAIAALGPAMGRDRSTTADARFSEALTLVYRVLFLLFAESRDLVPRHQRAYGSAYSLASLCRDAIRPDATAHAATDGLWDGLAAITRLSRSGCDTADLIIRPFNGRLFARSAAPSLETPAPARHHSIASRRRDRALATALTALGTRPGPGGRETISYADLGVEQLGAVYEHVLDLDVEEVMRLGRTEFDSRSRTRHGHRRKETGTFYTPRPLAAFVVRRTLAPLVHGASADDILSLRIVDPAMGSGAFLVAACRFLSRAYETALVQEGRCAETDLDAHERANIRRLIARRCLVGVDANPVAVQLARLSLWLTSLSKDKPLTFLDDRLRIGNSLVGARPDDLWRVRRSTDSSRRLERSVPLFDASHLETAMRGVVEPLRQLATVRDDSVADVHAKERIWSSLTSERSPLDPWRTACHLWCARWFWPDVSTKAPFGGELSGALDAILRGDRTLDPALVSRWIECARRSARDHHFFHWPLEFADAFYEDDGAGRDRPGFDAVIGNPPWEMLRDDHDDSARMLSFLRQSRLYPSCDRGHLNLYQPFLERSLDIVRPGGRVGLVLPWGLASDEGAAGLRRRLLVPPSIDTIVGLDNSAGIFPIHRGLRFMVLVASPGSPSADIRARFGVRTPTEIDELPGRDSPLDARTSFPVTLPASAIQSLGGASLRIPDARRSGDLDWLIRISRAFPRLGAADGWGVHFGRELNATDDRRSFGAAGLPVIDGKHIAPFAVKIDESVRRIEPGDAARLLPDRRFAYPRLAYRDVSAATNRFALIAAIVPGQVVTTHTLFCLRTKVPRQQQDFLCGLFNSSTLNTIVRMLMGGHVTTGLIESLPVPKWTGDDRQLHIAALGKRLTDAPMDSDATEQLDVQVAQLYEPRNL